MSSHQCCVCVHAEGEDCIDHSCTTHEACDSHVYLSSMHIETAGEIQKNSDICSHLERKKFACQMAEIVQILGFCIMLDHVDNESPRPETMHSDLKVYIAALCGLCVVHP